MSIKNRRMLVKAEASFGSPSTDFTDATFLPITGSGDTLAPSKVLQDIANNTAGAVGSQQIVGRNTGGQIPSQLDRASRRTVFDIAFGGFVGDNGGAPSRDKTFGVLRRKDDQSGQMIRGLACQTFALAAAAGGFVIPTLTCVAKGEERIDAPDIPLPAKRLRPYVFATALASINDAIADAVNNISLNVANNLDVGPAREGCLEPAYIRYGDLGITGSIGVQYRSEVYNDIVRGTGTASVLAVFGESYATHDGTGWNCSDFFDDDQPCVIVRAGVLSSATTSIVNDVLSNPGQAGDVIVQNPVVVKLPAVHVPDAPESSGTGGVVQQTVNFVLTAPEDGTVEPIEIWFDAVTNP